MGLFDSILKGTGNPEQDAAISRGLLQAGLQLMQARGKLFPALGQAGMAGMQATDQYRQQQLMRQRAALQDKLLQGQVGQQQREAEIAALPGQFYRAPSQTGIDATGGMETSTDLPSNQGGPGGFDAEGYINALRSKAGVIRAAQERAVLFPEPESYTLKPGDRRYRGTQPVAENPAPPETPKPSGLAQLLQERAALPPDSPMRQAYDDAIKKATTHQSPVQVSYGAPVAGVDAEGRPVFFQPGKGGGAPAIVPGVRPAPQNRDTKMPAEIQRMNIAADTMGKLLNDYEQMLEKYNPRDPTVQMNPAVRAEFQSLMKGIQLQFKEVQALGALAGPDLALMESAITDPFTFKGAYYGREGLRSQIKQARRLLQTRGQATADSQRPPESRQAEDTDPLGLRK